MDGNGSGWCYGTTPKGNWATESARLLMIPVAVVGGLTFAYLKAGELFTCGVTGEGVAYCWGDNEYGQLGDGTTRQSSEPVKVAFQP